MSKGKSIQQSRSKSRSNRNGVSKPSLPRRREALRRRKESTLGALGIQRSLKVGASNDAHEKEADTVAMKVMNSSVAKNSGTHDVSVGKASPKIRRKSPTANTGGFTVGERTAASVAGMKASGGRPLPAVDRGFLEPRFGADLSHVRVHTDSRAASTADAIQARAFTSGNHIAFNEGQYKPGTYEGRKLLAHEITHTFQQGGGAPGQRQAAVQRKFVPEDVAHEMVGREFSISQDLEISKTKLERGRRVKIHAWSNESSTVEVRMWKSYFGIPYFRTVDIPKKYLRPTRTKVKGIAAYSGNVDGSARNVEKKEKALEKLVGRRDDFVRAGNVEKYYNPELERIKEEQKNAEINLNRRLIQETMFNRFDPSIKKWTDYYNAKFRNKSWGNLDYNIVKSLIFQESQMGTAGTHLRGGQSPIKQRFNLTQAIDSYAEQQYIMMQEMYRSGEVKIDYVAKYNLGSMMGDLYKAKRNEKEKKNSAYWEKWLRNYTPPGHNIRFYQIIFEFLRSLPKSPNKNYDYWIRTGIRWLFHKRAGVKSWSEALYRYNGGGPMARKYREEVLERKNQAVRSEKRGRPFKPPKS